MFIVLSTSFSLLLAFTRGSTVSMGGVGVESDVVRRLHHSFILLLTAHWVDGGLTLIRTEFQSLVKCNSQPYEWKTHQTNFQLFHPPSILLPTNQSHFSVGYFGKFQIYACVVSRASQHFYSPYGTTQLEKTIKKTGNKIFFFFFIYFKFSIFY